MVVANGFGRLAQQHIQRQIHRGVVVERVLHLQMAVVGGSAHHGKRAAFALAQAAEHIQAFRGDGQHIALLRFIAPNLHRA